MIDISFYGNSALCSIKTEHSGACFVITYHPKLSKFTFEKKFSTMDCKSFNRFFSRCFDCVKAYYE